MRRVERFGWGVLFGGVGLLVLAGCNDEKKPPLTPDGPEMSAPADADAGPETPPPPATK